MWPGPLVRMSHFQTSIQAANLNPALFQHYNSIRKIIRGKILFSIERSMLERKQACGVTVEAGEAGVKLWVTAFCPHTRIEEDLFKRVGCHPSFQI